MEDDEQIREAHLAREMYTGKKEFKFEIGLIAASENVLNRMEKTKKQLRDNNKTEHGSFTNYVWDSFARHCLCDWGDITPEEKTDNEQALVKGGQLYSVYTNAVYPTISILTEEDRSETAIGLLNEFGEVDE